MEFKLRPITGYNRRESEQRCSQIIAFSYVFFFQFNTFSLVFIEKNCVLNGKLNEFDIMSTVITKIGFNFFWLLSNLFSEIWPIFKFCFNINAKINPTWLILQIIIST